MIDLIVVGGGPIGLAAAIEARLSGMAVTVVEPRADPIDKACGEGLMPGAIAALARLGVDPPGHALAGIRYLDRIRHVDHEFEHGQGRGVRRTVLHSSLADRANSLGIEVVRGKAAYLIHDAESVTLTLSDSTIVRSQWLFGCDGLHSRVRDLAGLSATSRGPRRFGLRRHFAVAPWSDFVEVHWTAGTHEHGGGAEVYVTPVGASEVGVAVLSPAHARFDQTVKSVPSLASHLAGAEVTSNTRGAGPLRQSARARTAGRVLLVGDASGYVDAITGEGIKVGLAQAHAAVDCVVSGEPLRYEREWRRVTRDYRLLTAGLVALGSSPLRRAVVPLAAKLPTVYGATIELLAR